MQRLLQHRLVRFVLIGGINTAFSYSIFAALVLAFDNHQLAVVTSTILGVLFNFFTTGRLVFGNHSACKLIPFLFAYAAALGLNMILIEVFLRLGMKPLPAQALCLPVVVVTAYLINARVVFRNSSQ